MFVLRHLICLDQSDRFAVGAFVRPVLERCCVFLYIFHCIQCLWYDSKVLWGSEDWGQHLTVMSSVVYVGRNWWMECERRWRKRERKMTGGVLRGENTRNTSSLWVMLESQSIQGQQCIWGHLNRCTAMVDGFSAYMMLLVFNPVDIFV